MKKIVMVTTVSIVCWGGIAFAEDVVNTSSSVTKTSKEITPEGAATQTTTQTTSTTSTIDLDGQIVAAIYERYKNTSALLGTTLTVTAKDGAITVDGTVTMQVQADEAVRVAKEVPGVKSVTSSISVTTNPPQDKSGTNTNY